VKGIVVRRSVCLDFAATAVIAALASTPAWAGLAPPAPAPIAGVGIGAIALLGLGYRAMKRRLDR